MKKLRLLKASLLATLSAIIFAVVLISSPVFANGNPSPKPSYITFGDQHSITNFETTFEWVTHDLGVALKLKNPEGVRPNGNTHLVFPKDMFVGWQHPSGIFNNYSTNGEIFFSTPYDDDYESNFRFNHPSTDEESHYWYSSWPTSSFGMLVFASDIDNQRPAISGQENFVTSVDDPKTISYFQSFLTAIDETDGDVTNSIYVVTDNYTTNKNIVGRHKIVFGVTDAAGNESTLEVYVNVVDITEPVITGNTAKVTISYTQTWNINTFKSTLVATDNYDSLTNADITIKSDGYTSNKTNLGTYSVVFSVKDTAGNEGTFTKQIEVIDDVAPTWSGPATLTKPTTAVLTINDIIQQLTATDAKEGNVSASIVAISDNYSGKGHLVGSYTVVFEASDSKGNKSTHTVTITVNDNIAPIWYIQDGVSIVLPQSVQLTHQQIVDILIASGQLQTGATTSYTFPVDEYSGNENLPGVYAMQVKSRSTNGNEYLHTFAITVMDDEDDGVIVEDFDKTFIDYITDFFGSIGTWFNENRNAILIWAGVGLVGFLIIGAGISKLRESKSKSRRRRK